ncbi:hypothetical protein [Lacibacter sp. H407]|uniref:hypothetical protein n=1 Tax=Lacibacter sp. H407 TaxID=3133423 RepID=UPI0030C1216A
MKIITFILSLPFFGCNSQTNNPSKQFDTIVVKNQASIDKSQIYAKGDSVIISSKHFDTIKYSKEHFNQIVDNFPSLYSSIPVNPDISYAQSGYFKDIVEDNGRKKHLTFGSEQGQDTYYILYSYFLRQKQNEKSLDTVRENLITIYQTINDIFGYLQYGGTFFVHQFNRINGYAEYGVYEYKSFSDIDNKLVDIRKLKKNYLNSLKEIIHREIEADNEIPQRINKKERENELLKHVATLDKLIDNNFYLKKAQQFQYSYY